MIEDPAAFSSSSSPVGLLSSSLAPLIPPAHPFWTLYFGMELRGFVALFALWAHLAGLSLSVSVDNLLFHLLESECARLFLITLVWMKRALAPSSGFLTDDSPLLLDFKS